MEGHVHHSSSVLDVDGLLSQVLLAIPFVIAFVIYLYAYQRSKEKGREWPIYRLVLFVLGTSLALVSVIGPLGVRAHIDFTYHMLGHLLLGMLAPLLIVLSAPMTLVLRALSVRNAKKLTKVLRSNVAGFFTDPIVASILNIGGLWVLYRTELYMTMHESLLLHLLIHMHVFLAGYLFTISLIYFDPVPHRRTYMYRTIVFIFALAGHGILSKQIYAYPPAGVPTSEAQSGGMLMYYGGDVIDAVIIVILFYQWYQSRAPRSAVMAT
ncbi:cytochrome c oxidase assembly protein [Alkalibacillus haloalkaliphilus]|uniref:Membrane protein n=1 Tax=Alkalibacillus haloalkaliphilus TaxID=94136 RepID=A0A511W4U5_9BACI|nr:cytochrome c oxidase assembly protein [Alkalibacillus haloalkaliphilus]GEN46126.1 membrane protein [Alkalibacillus haloalkaliphilus]